MKGSLLIVLLLALSMQGCFTGVESTPRITYSDVKKENIHTTPEQRFLTEVVPEPPSKWKPGKRFYVTDPKISIAFTSMSSQTNETLAGNEIAFHSMYPVKSVTGEDIIEIEFVSPLGGRLFFRDNAPYSDLEQRQQLEVPFTIEESIVEQAASMMTGKKYYIVTPLWYSPDGDHAVGGLRHIPVTIEEVTPGNSLYPLRVVFRPDGNENTYSVYMTVGTQRTSSRNFHTLFAFDNPRDKYPQINDETWNMIVHSHIQKGMTRDECRLALGSPQTIGQRPTTAGMVEYWSYSDGVYLLFEEGYLSYFRK